MPFLFELAVGPRVRVLGRLQVLECLKTARQTVGTTGTSMRFL